MYAVPDDDWGQRVCAAVVGTATEAELAAYVRERLSPPKRPKTWRFLDELPRTLTGKVRRDRLLRRSVSPSQLGRAANASRRPRTTEQAGRHGGLSRSTSLGSAYRPAPGCGGTSTKMRTTAVSPRSTATHRRLDIDE